MKKQKAVPQAVLTRAKAITKADAPKAKQPQAKQTSAAKAKVLAALKRLHPMD